jgi:hypothetical protein
MLKPFFLPFELDAGWKFAAPRRLSRGPSVRTTPLFAGLTLIYPVHLRTRKSSGDMMRKLSVTLSQNVFHLLGTSFRKKPSTASQKPL